jgi:hypothetical protein
LLAALERGDFLAGRALKIHCKQEGPDHQARHARRNILTDLEALLGSKLPDFLVVGSTSATMAAQSEYRSCG